MQFKDIKYVTEDGKLDGKLYFNVTVVMDDGTEIPYSYLDTEEDTSMVANIIREGLKNKSFELPKEFPVFEKEEVQTAETECLWRMEKVFAHRHLTLLSLKIQV